MSADEMTNDVTESSSLPADGIGDSSGLLQFIETVPVIRDTDDRCRMAYASGDLPDEIEQESLPVIKQEPIDNDGPSTTASDSGDCSAESKQEILPAVKQEPDDLHVSCTVAL